MLFVILGEDGPDSLAIRKQVRPAHLERIAALVSEGRLLLAGPMPAVPSPDPGPAGFSGSLIVAEFPSLEDAQDWIAGDPYVTAGVFVRHSVRPFVRVAP